MGLSRRRFAATVSLALLLYVAPVASASAQGLKEAPPPVIAPPLSLDLTPEKVSHLQTAMTARDYVAAEKLLISDIEQDPHSMRAARLLAYLGSVYFLNHDYLNAAIAWKKSDGITPLGSDLQFSLAMAYLKISHPDWARGVLESLATHETKNALYPYWLGRLDYDVHRYPEATQHFRQAIALDPGMARAYDNLGLCYFHQNDNRAAVESFNKAIALNQNSPSAWPYLNRAETLEFMGRKQEAEADLREAVRLNPQFAEAHYRLGNVLQELGRLEPAAQEMLEAVRLDNNYPEPHAALAHIYNQLGRKGAAQDEGNIYLRLRAGAKL